MNTTQLLLATIKRRDHLTSDVELLRRLRMSNVKISQQQLSNYLRGERQADADTVVRLCGIVPASFTVALARIEAERSRSGIAKNAWQVTASQLEAGEPLEKQLEKLPAKALSFFESKAA